MTSPAAERNDYLIISRAATFNAAGVATVVLTPDVGQYWAPTFCRVATNSSTSQTYCAVYQGGGAVVVQDGTTFVDDTFQGNSDSSSMIAGTVTQYGEQIVASWTGGITGQVAYFSIYGMSGNVPPALGLSVPQVAGQHFAGSPTRQFTSTIVPTTTGVSLTNATLTIVSFVDMRAWQSFSLFLGAVVTNGTATAMDTVVVQFIWQNIGVAGTTIISYDYAELLASTTGGVYILNGNLYYQDMCRGNFLTVTVRNPTLDPYTLSYSLSGSTRRMSIPYVRHGQTTFPSNGGGNGFDFVNIPTQFAGTIAIGAATSVNVPIMSNPGRIFIRLVTGAVGLTFTFRYGIGSQNFAIINVAAATEFRGELIMPKRACWIVVTNGGAASSYEIEIFTLLDRIG